MDREPIMLLKRFAAILILIVAATSVRATSISYVQSKQTVGNNFTSMAFNSNVVAGNRLFLIMSFNPQPVSVTDTVGSTWSYFSTGTQNAQSLHMYTAVAAGSGADTVSWNCGGSCFSLGVTILEYASTSPYMLIANAGTAQGTQTASSSGIFDVPSGTEIEAIAVFHNGSNGYTMAVSNGTMRQTSGSIPGGETQSVADANFTGGITFLSSYTPTITFSGGSGSGAYVPVIFMVAMSSGGGGGASNYGSTR